MSDDDDIIIIIRRTATRVREWFASMVDRALKAMRK
jgi:hypothetical protein